MVEFLTDKQKHIVDFMENSLREKRRPAKLIELSVEMDCNISTMFEHLQTIIKKGYVRKVGRYYLPVNTRCPTCGGLVL